MEDAGDVCHQYCKKCKPICKQFKKISKLKGAELYNYLEKEKEERGAVSDVTLNTDDKSSKLSTDEEAPPRNKEVRKKGKCAQCDTILQHVTGLIDEIREIRQSRTRILCEHCKLSRMEKCPRCHDLMSNYIANKVDEYDKRQERYEEWLCKLKRVLVALLEGDSTCVHKEQAREATPNDELENLLQQLKTPLVKRERELNITQFPAWDFKEVMGSKTSLTSSMAENLVRSGKILEEVLAKLKLESDKKKKLAVSRNSGSSQSDGVLSAVKTSQKEPPKKAMAEESPIESGFALLPPQRVLKGNIDKEAKKEVIIVDTPDLKEMREALIAEEREKKRLKESMESTRRKEKYSGKIKGIKEEPTDTKKRKSLDRLTAEKEEPKETAKDKSEMDEDSAADKASQKKITKERKKEQGKSLQKWPVSSTMLLGKSRMEAVEPAAKRIGSEKAKKEEKLRDLNAPSKERSTKMMPKKVESIQFAGEWPKEPPPVEELYVPITKLIKGRKDQERIKKEKKQEETEKLPKEKADIMTPEGQKSSHNLTIGKRQKEKRGEEKARSITSGSQKTSTQKGKQEVDKSQAKTSQLSMKSRPSKEEIQPKKSEKELIKNEVGKSLSMKSQLSMKIKPSTEGNLYFTSKTKEKKEKSVTSVSPKKIDKAIEVDMDSSGKTKKGKGHGKSLDDLGKAEKAAKEKAKKVIEAKEVTSKKRGKGKRGEGDDGDVISESDEDKENKKKKMQEQKEKHKPLKASPSAKLLLVLLKEKEKERKLRDKQAEKKKKALKNIKIPFIPSLPVPKVSKHTQKRRYKHGLHGADSNESLFLHIEECPSKSIIKNEMIAGSHIVPYDPYHQDVETDSVTPLLFKVQEICTTPPSPAHPSVTSLTSVVTMKKEGKAVKGGRSPGSPWSHHDMKGVLRYTLSDREYIDKGYTKLPSMKIMRRMNIYKMHQVNPENDWFRRHRDDKILFYDAGEKLAEIDNDCYGRWYYRNGILALDYYKAKEQNVGNRYVIYSSGERDVNGKERPITVLASFDHLGNGVVYDHYGNIRLKYNQSEGVIMDERIGPIGRWKWHSLNDPPLLHTVYVDNYLKLESRGPCLDKLLAHVDKYNTVTEVIENEATDEMLTIEVDKLTKEKAIKALQKYKPFQIKMKALRINEQFSLHIIDQANIYLLFRDSQVSFKLDLGMSLISTEIIDTEAADISQILTPYDRLIPRSESVADIRRILGNTRRKCKTESLGNVPYT